ncbi:glyoxalase family protein [Paenibacillus taihuensis]|uniref:Glyoxalase family protein n=1 Tax=Paenibacillus taihuensis TaxID=1156355 RepID=A0A3D9QVJ6_9BACL|nr:VOC family protein [Paenibacillus taihuensis]REE68127.1 glyoxalase family protein [Paenibacillus taihuensis]
MKTAGIHHITAFVRNVQDSVDFYAGILGLRLVKQTINFDVPSVYHLYFGNEMGSPGTVITFFPFEKGRQGKIGAGQVGWSSFAIPAGTLAFWENRLTKFGIEFTRLIRFNETFLRFTDRDGLQLELVERNDGMNGTWSFGDIPAEKAIKGFGGAVLFSKLPADTGNVLEDLLGFKKVGVEQGFSRYRSYGDRGNIVDIDERVRDDGHGGPGSVHHIAWRAEDDNQHAEWREAVIRRGLTSTPFQNRQYFNAIYFREPGGILFEIATDPPGFTVDEPLEELGESLQLPSWYEDKRAALVDELTHFEVRSLDSTN